MTPGLGVGLMVGWGDPGSRSCCEDGVRGVKVILGSDLPSHKQEVGESGNVIW